MGSRGRLAFLVALGAGLLATVTVLALARAPRDAPAPPTATGFSGSVRPATMPKPDFALRDERGRSVRLSSLRGRPVAIAFLYATCEDTCPVTAQQVRGALDRVGGKERARALFVSVDPPGDTPRTARSFLSEQRVLGRIPFLLGSQRALTPVWRAFAVQPQEKGREHAVSVVLLDAAGRQRVGFHASDATVGAIAHDLRVLLRRSA
jgi:protein SCO1